MYYLRRLIDDEHEAANALQETWLGAFRNLRSLREDSRLAPWLYTIARRTAMNQLRLRYATPDTLSEEPIADETAEASQDQLNLEHAELVHFGLSRLGVREREALTLSFLNDLSVGEIAALLEIPPGTVKSRLFKARRDLRRVLDEEAQRHER